MKLTQSQQEAIKELKHFVKPNTTLIIQIVKVSGSGMSRRMRVYTADKKTGRLLHHTYTVAQILDYKYNDDNTITIKGCGMDMTFWLADTITYYLYRDKKPNSLTGNGGTTLEWQTI